MATAQKSLTMKASKDQILTVLKDYESYSEFMDGVSKVEVESRDGNKVMAKYDLNVIKTFSYVLALTESDDGISWTFDNGDIFATNAGSWELTDNGDGTTDVVYNIDIEIKIKMMGTGMITKKLVNTSLPSMMKAVEKRAQGI
jgi:ribosome-associated toxin RatA of RatAB toxin-antitoxin module